MKTKGCPLYLHGWRHLHRLLSQSFQIKSYKRWIHFKCCPRVHLSHPLLHCHTGPSPEQDVVGEGGGGNLKFSVRFVFVNVSYPEHLLCNKIWSVVMCCALRPSASGTLRIIGTKLGKDFHKVWEDLFNPHEFFSDFWHMGPHRSKQKQPLIRFLSTEMMTVSCS